MDGARIFNAMTTVGCEIVDIARNANSISICLSKGLCCPIGSVLVGPADFIDRARSLRNCLGGEFDNPSLFAACGIVALREMTEPLKEDHKIAVKIG
jgi:threonine aldolase